MYVPEGYYHKATNESFNSGEKVEIYHSTVEDDYLVIIGIDPNDIGYYFTKTQLELLVLAGTDVLNDEKV
jgi:hypothetical protein